MTEIVVGDARASLFNTFVASHTDVAIDCGASVRSYSSSHRLAQDYSLFDHVDSSRAASSYSRSHCAKRADRYRTVLYLLAIFCL